MSIIFSPSTSDYLSRAEALPGAGGMVAVWVRSAHTPATTRAIWRCYNSGGSHYVECNILPSIFSKSATILVNGSSPFAQSVTGWPASTYFSLQAGWTSGGSGACAIRITNGAWTSGTHGLTLSGLNTFEVGRISGPLYMNGQLAMMALATSYSTGGDDLGFAMDAVANGFSPFMFDASIFPYIWTFDTVGHLTSQRGGKVLSSNGSPATGTNNPRIYRPEHRLIVPQAAVATRRVSINGVVMEIAA